MRELYGLYAIVKWKTKLDLYIGAEEMIFKSRS